MHHKLFSILSTLIHALTSHSSRPLTRRLSSTVSVQNIMRQLFTILLIVVTTSSLAEDEYLLFKENLAKIVKNDNFVQCNQAEIVKYGGTKERCVKVKKDAEAYCANLVNKLEPNKLTHSEWEKRMGYFLQCRVIVVSGCKYSFEASDLIEQINLMPKDSDKSEYQNKLVNLLHCKEES